ncbi:MAG: hypothetical protein A2076_02515 [Geobacteraceae bacterium GWC2_53_11]|nr:MAG: hypothetical protein A2076_02515 [Geobacteraceae bacterium GWC2_53_11]
MTLSLAHNQFIAFVLIIIYLALPATLCAQSVVFDAEGDLMPTISSTANTSPLDTCPCSDGHDSDCCDTTGCSCACHAPLGQRVRLAYAPVVVAQNFREPFWLLPQVYLAIFVPPQNLA